MEKEELIKEIKHREEQLDKQKLLRQIELKESQLQRLLADIDQTELNVPANPGGVWKIESQKLDGKPIPKSEWIVPKMSPDFRNEVCLLVNYVQLPKLSLRCAR